MLLPQHTGEGCCHAESLVQELALDAAYIGHWFVSRERPAPLTLQAIIYVVDSSDTERIGISREEFHAILSEDELKDALVLVYANKQVCAVCMPCTVHRGQA